MLSQMYIYFFDLNQTQSLIGYAWLLAALLFLIIELTVPGFFIFTAIACGYVAAAVTAFLGYDIIAQICSLVLGTSLAFILIKYFFSSSKKTPTLKTNIDALIRQEAIVIETIQPHIIGRVKVRGEEWPAIAHDSVNLQKGTIVTVVGLEGNKLIVK
jgi:inner membrane protein